ncbi:hypothetical protein BH11ACT3_BH11ACT3_19590 [soil metagenome]
MSDAENSGSDEGSHDATAAHHDEPSALMTRLRVIEDQPLEARAESLAQLHEELRSALEAGDNRSHA